MRTNKNGFPILAQTRQSAKKMYAKVHTAYLQNLLLCCDIADIWQGTQITLNNKNLQQKKNATIIKKAKKILDTNAIVKSTHSEKIDNNTDIIRTSSQNNKQNKKIIQEILALEEIPFYPNLSTTSGVSTCLKTSEPLLADEAQVAQTRTLSTPDGLSTLPHTISNGIYSDIESLLKGDLFYLLVFGLNRKDMDNDWLFERCREVQKNPNDYLDLWAREHYKSTIITIGLTIQNILNNPNITVGIFSHTRPIAKAFLRQIKREWETNTLLRAYFPHICAPEKSEARTRTWSEDGGLIVKRDGNPKEATLEAWGLVDGQPTGKHFDLLLYDDVVTLESVSTPEQIKKTTDAWRLSLNLGARDGHLRMIGTRYHATDTYHLIMEQGSVTPRIHPATKDGLSSGEAVFLDNKTLAKKRRDMGPYVFACQMLQNPLADNAMGFKKEWFQTLTSTGLFDENVFPNNYDITNNYTHHTTIQQSEAYTLGVTQNTLNTQSRKNLVHAQAVNGNTPQTKYLGTNMNRYIVVDPASSKKEGSDYTSMWVIGLNHDGLYYVIVGVHDRLALHERAEALFNLHRKHAPLAVGYEQYGIQADIEHIKYRMEHENYRFSIIPLGGSMAKSDRIRRLVPIFEQKRLWFPHKIVHMRTDRSAVDLVQEFYQKEYLNFPVAGHDDMLDCLSRILDNKLGAVFPMRYEARPQSSHNFFQ